MKKSGYIILAVAVLAPVSCAPAEEEQLPPIKVRMTEEVHESPDCYTDEGPCVTIHFIYPEFTGEGGLLDKIRQWTAEQMYQSDIGDTSESSEELAGEWYNDYNEYAEAIDDYNISWTLERRVELVFDSPNLISLHFNEFSFTGGAHPVQIDHFRSFEKPHGDKIHLDDLTYNQAQFDRLTALAEEQFRFTYELLEGEDIEEAGYWFVDGEFHLPDNFAFTDFGLLFYYNVYEVAPYASGPISIELSYEELESIIKPRWMELEQQLTYHEL